MGNGMFSRRHKRIFQSLVLLTVIFGLLYGAMLSYEMHKQLKRTEAIAVKYQQHQESLSAQLQDFHVYKLEAQQSLNKDKQDSTSRFNSLNVQHEMLKNQHDELKKRYYGLHEEHQLLREDHNRALTEHKDKYDNLQQEKEIEISKLKGSCIRIHKGGQQPVGNIDDLQQEAPNIGVEREERDHAHPSEHVVHREENRDRRREGFQVQPVEEDHRKELAEEEMEQAGLPEHLDEESDQPQEEEEKEGHQKEEQPPAHAEQEEAGVIHEDINETAKEHGGSQQRLKSAYEEQLDQQRLVARREEEARQLKERQESLHRQRLREQMDRQQQLRDRELQLQREADHKEQILRRQQQQQQPRQQPEYENIDADIVQGDEERDIQKQDDGHEHPHVEEGGHEQQDEDPEEEHAKDANPQEDPNNQGEDEFEEAEKEKRNNLPDANAEHKKHLENMAKPEVDEQLVMAGNPDQQEDTLNEQYQEEGEEEVHNDLAEGPKVEQEENEEAYNEENEEGVSPAFILE
ncbi:Golgi integral membrane protein 4 [Acipenser ruthenus]|uniref:Golgi integral membrane protein 4 n=1 Tax=Acipenser ruthenus TaxID=7906 RepID=A0A444UDA9_ACIRT|nr:Golgi integral membrane protein 4 [Acipenser ruthenus]